MRYYCDYYYDLHWAPDLVVFCHRPQDATSTSFLVHKVVTPSCASFPSFFSFPFFESNSLHSFLFWVPLFLRIYLRIVLLFDYPTEFTPLTINLTTKAFPSRCISLALHIVSTSTLPRHLQLPFSDYQIALEQFHQNAFHLLLDSQRHGVSRCCCYQQCQPVQHPL